MNEKKSRIIWIDVYKAIAITLVVIGHATGAFNQYIYQFHLAAFFFVSGYVANVERDGILQTFIKKIYTLILPLFIGVIACGLIMEILYRNETYKIVFGELPYIGFLQIIKCFFVEGSIYAWVLGAAWFLIVLFVASLITKLLWEIALGKTGLFIGYTTLVYIIGYIVASRGTLSIYHIDLAFISQFFYGMGYVVKKKQGKKLNEIKLIHSGIGAVITSLIIYLCGKIPNVSIDYASGTFHNIFLNTFTSIIGIVCLYCIASMVSKVRYNRLIDIMVVIGQNTMGVVLIHFIMFKMVAAMLYFVDIASLNEIARTTPSIDISTRFWWMYVLVSESISVLLWKLLTNIPVLNTLLGTNKKIIQKIEYITSNVCFWKNGAQKTNIHMSRFFETISSVILVSVYLVLLGCFCRKQYQLQQALDISFPNDLSEEIVKFDAGWQPQGNEDYRWIVDQGTLIINNERHSTIYVSGYVPENFNEVTMLDVYIDEHHMGTIDFSVSRNFEVTYDIDQLINSEPYRLVLDFNGVHKPEAGGDDVRELSGLINRICIE